MNIKLPIIFLQLFAIFLITHADDKKKIIVTSILEEPFLSRNELGKYEGFSQDLASQIASNLGLDYELRIVKDGLYGKLDPITNKWAGMIGEVIEKDADMAIAPLTMNSERIKAVDFSTPFMTAKLSILIKKSDDNCQSHYSFLKPFGYDLWGAIIVASLVIFGLLIADQGLRSRVFDLKEFILQQNGPSCNSSHSATGSLAAKTIRFTFAIFLTIIFASYIASYASRQIHGDNNCSSEMDIINSFEDLASREDLSYGILAKGSTEKIFEISTNQHMKKMLKRMRAERNLFANFKDGLDRVKEGNFAFIIESPSAHYIANQVPCDLIANDIGEDSGPLRFLGIATIKNSILSDKVNQAVLELSETGIISKLVKKWWTENSECSVDEHNWNQNMPSQLTLEEMAGIFYILIAGIFLALCVGLFERKFKSSRGDTNNIQLSKVPTNEEEA